MRRQQHGDDGAQAQYAPRLRVKNRLKKRLSTGAK
jgi:hypothetical protein